MKSYSMQAAGKPTYGEFDGKLHHLVNGKMGWIRQRCGAPSGKPRMTLSMENSVIKMKEERVPEPYYRDMHLRNIIEAGVACSVLELVYRLAEEKVVDCQGVLRTVEEELLSSCDIYVTRSLVKSRLKVVLPKFDLFRSRGFEVESGYVLKGNILAKVI